MKKNDELTKLSIFVVPISWVVGAIVALLFYFLISSMWMKSYILGLVTSLLNFGLQIQFGKGFIREVNKAEGTPVRKNLIGFFVRLLLAGVIFAYVVYDEFSGAHRFDVIPTLIGYLTVKVVLIISSLIIFSKGKVSA